MRRLQYDKPIKDVSKITVNAHGASGKVAEVSDGVKSVIVKADQHNAAEVVAADNMMRGGMFKSRKYKVEAPKSRIASAADIAELKAKVKAPGVMVSKDERNFVTGLSGSNPAIVAEAMSSGGEMMDTLLKSAVNKWVPAGEDAGKPAVTTVDKGQVKEIKKLVTSTGPIKAMAKASAADAAMGMGDRVLTFWNAKNFLFNPKTKTFAFVDNTSSTNEGTLTDKMTLDGFENARYSFNEWVNADFVRDLGKNVDALAEKFVRNFTGIDKNGDEMPGFGIMQGFDFGGRCERGGEEGAGHAEGNGQEELQVADGCHEGGIHRGARDGDQEPVEPAPGDQRASRERPTPGRHVAAGSSQRAGAWGRQGQGVGRRQRRGPAAVAAAREAGGARAQGVAHEEVPEVRFEEMR